MFDKCRNDYLGKDSTYAVIGGHLTNGDGGGDFRKTALGVGATAEQIRKATTIRFTCITAMPSCRAASDLMPDAARDISFEPNPDPLFTKDCEAYVKQVEVGKGPWKLETAFAPDPVSVNAWILTRSAH
jgi:hypothetical protein